MTLRCGRKARLAPLSCSGGDSIPRPSRPLSGDEETDFLQCGLALRGAMGALIAVRQRMGVSGGGGMRLFTKLKGIVYTLYFCCGPLLDETAGG